MKKLFVVLILLGLAVPTQPASGTVLCALFLLRHLRSAPVPQAARPPSLRLIKSFPVKGSWVEAISASPNGRVFGAVTRSARLTTGFLSRIVAGLALQEIVSQVGLYDLAGNRLAHLELPGRAVLGWTNRETQFFTGRENGRIDLWDTYTGAHVAWTRVGEGRVGDVQAFSLDGRSVALVKGQEVQVHRLTLSGGGLEATPICQYLVNDSLGAIVGAAFSPSGNQLLIKFQRSLATYDLRKEGQFVSGIASRRGPIYAQAFFPGEETLAVGLVGGAQYWTPVSETVERLAEDDTASTQALAVSARGRFLAKAASEGGLEIWDFVMGGRFRAEETLVSPSVIGHLTFIPHTRLLLASDGVSSLQLYRIDDAAIPF